MWPVGILPVITVSSAAKPSRFLISPVVAPKPARPFLHGLFWSRHKLVHGGNTHFKRMVGCYGN